MTDILADKVAEPASEAELTDWVRRFSAYRQQPTLETLRDWLNQFAEEHWGMARKILDAVEIVSEVEIHKGYQSSLHSLPGWSHDQQKRRGRWYFVGAGGAGESGQAMLRMFREANHLTGDNWQSFFVTHRELPGLNLSAYDHIVFVDDFAGTGSQIVGYWPTMQELVASEASCYLLLTAMTEKAQQTIQSATELHLRVPIVLSAEKNLFSPQCKVLNEEEKAVLEQYGRKAWKPHPRGFGGCGLTIVLSHKTPNNTIPVLHANNGRWVGPFPRTLIAA